MGVFLILKREGIYAAGGLLLLALLPLKIILPAIWTGNEPLYTAIREGNIDRVRGLLDNTFGDTSRLARYPIR